MNCWLRRLIAVIQIGGGFMGIIITLQALANGDKDSLYITSNIVFAMFFVLGIAAGAALLESAPLGLFLSKIFQLIQIPVISSPFFQYSFVSGVFGTITFGSSGLNNSLEVGSSSLFLLANKTPWNFGVNLAAVFFFICLIAISGKNYKQEKSKVVNKESSTANNSPVYTRRSNQFLYASADSKN